MATKIKTKQKNMVKSEDVFRRINYLYQLAHHTLTRLPKANLEMVRFHCSTLKTIAKRHVLSIHPDIKRTLCKKCHMLLIPGLTCTVRHRRKRQRHIVVTCTDCRTLKRFVTDLDYKLWVEQPQAWLDTNTNKPHSTSSKVEQIDYNGPQTQASLDNNTVKPSPHSDNSKVDQTDNINGPCQKKIKLT